MKKKLISFFDTLISILLDSILILAIAIILRSMKIALEWIFGDTLEHLKNPTFSVIYKISEYGVIAAYIFYLIKEPIVKIKSLFLKTT